MNPVNLKSTPETPANTPRNYLTKFFTSIVSGKQVNIDIDVIKVIFHKHFKINLDALQPVLATILPYVLVYHMNNWPEWKRIPATDTLPLSSWYKEFVNFLDQKVNEAIKEHFNEVVEEIRNERIEKDYKVDKPVNKITQTENSAITKPEADFVINVKGKPGLLNTIVFTGVNKNDVIMKLHIPVPWANPELKCISIKQLISWPHIGVHLFSPILSFSRKNVHKYNRYISFVLDPLPSVEVDFVENIKYLTEEGPKICYSFDYVKKLTSDFLKALKNVFINPLLMETYQVVITEFLTDLEDLKVLSDGIPTNTSVTFSIGKSAYYKNKKLSRGVSSKQDVGYTEIVTPQMETSVIHVAEAADVTPYLEFLEDASRNSKPSPALPYLTYSCLFCQRTFDTVQTLVEHFKQQHTMEPPLKCTVCKKIFCPIQLTKNRWRHECTGSSVPEASSSGK